MSHIHASAQTGQRLSRLNTVMVIAGIGVIGALAWNTHRQREDHEIAALVASLPKSGQVQAAFTCDVAEDVYTGGPGCRAVETFTHGRSNMQLHTDQSATETLENPGSVGL